MRDDIDSMARQVHDRLFPDEPWLDLSTDRRYEWMLVLDELASLIEFDQDNDRLKDLIAKTQRLVEQAQVLKHGMTQLADKRI